MKTLVVLPTYNESATIAEVLRRLRASASDTRGLHLPPPRRTIDLLVVADNSPDGTGDPAAALTHAPAPGEKQPHRRVGRGLRLPGRDGLQGRAGRRDPGRGPDRVPRPHARPVEDVVPDHRRGARPGHLVGPAGPPPGEAEAP